MHPFDWPTKVPPRVASVLLKQAELGPKNIAEQRKETLNYYKERKKALKTKEEAIHSALHPDVREVVRNKQILLFKEMLRDIEYDDIAVADLLCTGVDLVGKLPPVGIWRPAQNEPTIGLASLWASAPAAQNDVAKERGEGELSEELWNLTLEEVKTGGIKGPFSKDELNVALGPRWVASRRFPVIQGTKKDSNGVERPKIRPIDDFSEYGINPAFGSSEKVSLYGVDQIVAWSKIKAQSTSNRNVSITDSAGRLWKTTLAEDWTEDMWTSTVGRVADLKAAYKQLASAPKHASLAVIAVKEPGSGRTKFFRTMALMFGQTAAVYAFLRFSRALAALASKLLNLVLVEFFDDFTQIESPLLAQSAQASFEAIIELLGWELAEGEKRLPFNSKFIALGVAVDLSDSCSGTVKLSNKPGRVESISIQVEEALRCGYFGFKDALSVRGKVAFAEGQHHGKIAAPVARLLSRWQFY